MSHEIHHSLDAIFERYQGISPTAFFTHVPDRGNTFLSVLAPESGVAVLSQDKKYCYYTLDADASTYLMQMGITRSLLEAMGLEEDPSIQFIASAHLDSYGILSFIHPDDGVAQSEVSYGDYWPGFMCDMVAPEDIIRNPLGYDALALRYSRPGNQIPQFDEQFVCSYSLDVQEAYTALMGMPMQAYCYGRN